VPAVVREQLRERSDERAVGGSKRRSRLLTSQNRELVPQQHQLHILGELGSATADEQPQSSGKGKVGEGKSIERSSQAQRTGSRSIDLVSFQRFLILAHARETDK
jgi:hypothetical protein